MFCFILRRNVLQQIITTDLTTPSLTHLYSSLFLQNPSSLSNTTITTTQNPSSFTVSYLINSCGLSQESAFSASQKIQLKSPEGPDSVLKLFQNHGFTNTHIAEIIAKRPLLLLSSVNKTLKPKLDFFHSMGLTGPTLSKILSADPGLLYRSLNNQIVPAVDFLKSFVHTDENIATSFKHYTRFSGRILKK
ncbi:uncharacterized protein LOC131236294 [Magnolia sinica]|uniref:uncharacterized protein LOC131236294 n=1 Tax=Magnolia sinica TaxID=86752 RepID=UPI00265A756E|nr:uncharacterized protein LOC131236294 [Magnolia sinica]